MHPEYRRDIDGLRALAVIFVVIYHAFPSVVPAGFIGVDVFFVISGYLISRLIFIELEQRRFTFREFYYRRARRILPALLVLVAVVLLAGFLMMTPDEFSELGQHAAASVLFVANFSFWHQAGYFDGVPEYKPLLHLWSLGVEEQFYLLLPPLLWIIWRHARRVQLVILVALGSFLINIAYVLTQNETSAFFLPQARIWEFLVGTFLALRERDGAELEPKVRDAVSIAGLIALFVGAWICRAANYPGFWALIPVGATMLLIASGPNAIVNRSLLSAKPVVFVGLISYSLYLWHWPLLSFPRIISMQPLSLEVRVAAVILSFILAALSYWYVETPFRRRAATLKMAAWLSAAGTALLAIGIAAAGTAVSTLPVRALAPGEARIVRATKAWDYPNARWKPFRFEGERFYARRGSGQGEALFIGDSNMEQYAPRIDNLIAGSPNGHLSAIFATKPGCPPIPGVVKQSDLRCDSYVRKALDYARQPKVETVVIGAFWNAPFGSSNNEYLYRGEGVPQGQGLAGDHGEAAYASLTRLISQLRKESKTVYLLLPMPTGDVFEPRAMFERSPFAITIQRSRGVAKSEVSRESEAVRNRLIKIAQNTGAEIIDPFAKLCPADLCPTVDASGEAMYRDKNHLSPFFVRKAVEYLDPTLKPKPGL